MEIPVVKVRGSRVTPNVPKASDDINKQYIFQLLKTYEKQKPVDGKTGELSKSPYPPFFGVVNSGMAWDADYLSPSEAKKLAPNQKKGGQRRWRLLSNFPSIWVDEQIDPLPTAEDLASNMNDLIFRNGVLRVFGHETMKLKALMLNNAFAGCARPLKNVPREYELLDQDKIDREVLESLDSAFEAEQIARSLSGEGMYSLADYFGIDLTKSDDAIKRELINHSRSNPKVFNREYVNPINKYKYTILEALSANILSGTIVPGTVYFVETNTKVWDMKGTDIAEEIATNAFAGDTAAKTLVERVDKLLKDIG